MVTSSQNRPGTPSPAGSTSQGPEPSGRRDTTSRSASSSSLGWSLRQRAGTWIRKRGVGPYLLLLPATAVIAALILWPAVQVGLFSFQDYSLPQISGVLPTQWIGFANYSQILHDPEFWASLKISLYFAVVVVPLTLIAGTLVGLLLERLGPRMRMFVSVSAILAWATPAVSASVIFAWLVDPDGGVVDWALAKLPLWLGGGAHWAGYS
jgi:N,N'-diacetylchitobiose transport system permease protein